MKKQEFLKELQKALDLIFDTELKLRNNQLYVEIIVSNKWCVIETFNGYIAITDFKNNLIKYFDITEYTDLELALLINETLENLYDIQYERENKI